MKTNYCYRPVYLLSLMTILMAAPGMPLMATPAQKPLYLGYNSPPLMCSPCSAITGFSMKPIMIFPTSMAMAL